MPRRAQSADFAVDPAYAPIVKLLILRLLVVAGAQCRFFYDGSFRDETVARFLGFSDAQIASCDVAASRRHLARMHARAEAACIDFPEDSAIAANIRLLSAELGMGIAEQRILHFITLERTVGMLADIAELVGYISLDRLICTLSAALKVPVPDVRAALDVKGKFAQAGILTVDRRRGFSFRQKIDVEDAFPDEMTVPHNSLLDLFASHFVASPAPTVSTADYPHLAPEIKVLKAYLEDVLQQAHEGSNILLYGPPGTGKTELVRAITAEVSADLYEVTVQSPGGEAKEGKARFNAYRMAQTLLSRARHKLILFDEVEDVFVERKFNPADNENGSGIKGWVNRALECNPVPTFWITNSLDSLDAAYRRRFDMCILVDVPPRSVRRKMLDRCVDGLNVSGKWCELAASHEALSPALIGRASKVVHRLRSQKAFVETESAMSTVLNNSLRSLGHGPIPDSSDLDAIDYQIEYLNTDCNLAELSDGLRRSGSARLCLYGPPGTGKSAFGRHLAQLLDRPLLLRRASDLLSPYVGMTERNLARAFREADADRAVLLLDEADGFLQDRKNAQRSWEVTQVNELLTQMEAFKGVFVASTNLVDRLDEASLRRFDIKIFFDYLSDQQRWEMFTAFMAKHALRVDETLRGPLLHLKSLTPGDFAAVSRRMKLLREPSGQAVLRLLGNECAIKREANKQAIGFG